MTVSRPHYRERQRLQASDLTDEQAYQVARRRRHNLVQHQPGVVEGLGLAIDTDPQTAGVRLHLRPGLAVDGYGRELVVPSEVVVPMEQVAALFEASPVQTVTLSLVYGRTEAAPKDSAGVVDETSRWYEIALLRVEAADVELPEDWTAWSEPFAPLPLDQDPPDDTEHPWPVGVGQIHRQGAGGQPSDYKLTSGGRQPLGVVAGEMVNPRGDTRLSLGSREEVDRRRFAIRFDDGTGAPTDALILDDQGDLTLQGLTRLEQRVCLNGALAFTPATQPDQPAPWQMYSVSAVNDGPPEQRRLAHLRFELPAPTAQADGPGGPQPDQVRVGAWGKLPPRDANDKEERWGFLPSLEVMPKAVNVYGDLWVQGAIAQGPIQADPNDPRFAAALIEQWNRGITAATTALVGSVSHVSGANLLAITITLTSGLKAGSDVTHTITIKNPPPPEDQLALRADAVQVHVAVTVVPSSAPARDLYRGSIGTIRTLAAGAERTVPGPTVQLPSLGEDTDFIISVFAVGVTQLNTTIFGSATLAQPVPQAF